MNTEYTLQYNATHPKFKENEQLKYFGQYSVQYSYIYTVQKWHVYVLSYYTTIYTMCTFNDLALLRCLRQKQTTSTVIITTIKAETAATAAMTPTGRDELPSLLGPSSSTKISLGLLQLLKKKSFRERICQVYIVKILLLVIV